MKLIVGLGNPGREYANNRHNLGFLCLNYLAKAHGIQFNAKQGLARTGTGEIAGQRVTLARPQTYMNSSGDSVKRLMHRLNLKIEDLIVITDDLDLRVGKVRIRLNGSSGGHKGIESIIASLGSRDFIRIKVGIGRPSGQENRLSEDDVISYVLSDFTPEENQVIAGTIPKVSEAIVCLLTEGMNVAMNKYNQ